MLDFIRLVNYQGHRDTIIHLAAGITGIIGVSLSGKTSIVRGFRWLNKNRPLGFKFHSNFTDSPKTEVHLGVDKQVITARKTAAKTHIYKIDTKKDPFRRVNREVPDEVEDLINVRDINVQDEWDNPFLITGSHGEMAKTISKAIQTDIIEKGIAQIRKEASRVRAEQKIVSGDIEEIKLNIDSFEELEDVHPLIVKLKAVRKKLDSLDEEKAAILDVVDEIEEAKSKIKKGEGVLKARPMFDELLKVDRELRDLETERQLLENIQNASSWITTAEKSHEKMVGQYISILKKEGKCPTCFGPLDNETIRRIRSEINIPKQA